jgi:hypothetical protein
MKDPNLKELQSTECMRLLYIAPKASRPSGTKVFTVRYLGNVRRELRCI